ncbi:unnamed protein product [Nezara viridula]|uniref:aspartate transaminase n=1 Tax=Nezara viridula TaxID=85310 RepID=A0A9P0MUQ1_NEZVI|nr:unnamed protein product [Nezara viridula]
MPFNFVKKLKNILEVDIGVVVTEDLDPRKINAFHQCYRSEMGIPWVLPIVKEIEVLMTNEMLVCQEELPGFGLNSFRTAVTELVLGKDNDRVANGHVLTVQSLSTVGALRMISEIAWKQLKLRQIYVPDSTWAGDHPTFLAAGFPKPKTYRYYDHDKHELDIEGMIQDLQEISSDAVVVFYSCCHNPTGCDPTPKQWKRIVEAIGATTLFPLIDLSYQGLASGDPDIDAFPIRLFARLGIEMAVCITFGHNFLLYNDRIGAAMFFVRRPDDIPPLKSHLAALIDSMYGIPPYHGAKIVATILNTPKYYEQWIGYLNKIRNQTQEARNNFVAALKRFDVPGNWNYISKGTGMNAFINLTDRQIQHLILYHHVYIRTNASLNVGALSDDKIEYVAEAIADCIKEYPAVEESDK